MGNPATDDQPERFIARGAYLGYSWEVTTLAHRLPYRAGYVRMPPGHPWHGKEAADIPASVHCGITYAKPGSDGSWWIGFHCGYGGRDAPDPSLPGYDRFGMGRMYEHMIAAGCTVKTTGYVIEQCRWLIRQARTEADKIHREFSWQVERETILTAAAVGLVNTLTGANLAIAGVVLAFMLVVTIFSFFEARQLRAEIRQSDEIDPGSFMYWSPSDAGGEDEGRAHP